MTVRTRIAPSPTGMPHLGTAYIALFNKAFAEQCDGDFILRIEDSDQARSDRHSEAAIIELLTWLGLSWDEGPDIGGPKGPYRTSARIEHYRDALTELLDRGGAFHCFCSQERLDTLRATQQKAGETPSYDGLCLGLDRTEVDARLERGEPHTVRLNVPRDGSCTFTDGIRGEISIPWQQVDMQILLKSDGFPTYHLCAPVDDHLMGITHILRGEEWLNSCPKHTLLYEYLDWKFPECFHLPLLRNPDQSKLSKRKNPTSIGYYRDRGYLPEAILNYLATMGWSMSDGREVFGYDDIVRELDLTRISPRGPVFDSKKLDWLNGTYLRSLTEQDFQDRYLAWSSRNTQIASTAPLVQDRVDRFDQVLGHVDYLFGERQDLALTDFEHKSLTNDQCIQILDFTDRVLDRIGEWSAAHVQAELSELAEQQALKIRDLLFPLFLAISGRTVALPLFDSIEMLGRDLVKNRLRTAIDALGGVSKKQRRRLDKRWQELNRSSTS